MIKRRIKLNAVKREYTFDQAREYFQSVYGKDTSDPISASFGDGERWLNEESGELIVAAQVKFSELSHAARANLAFENIVEAFAVEMGQSPDDGEKELIRRFVATADLSTVIDEADALERIFLVS